MEGDAGTLDTAENCTGVSMKTRSLDSLWFGLEESDTGSSDGENDDKCVELSIGCDWEAWETFQWAGGWMCKLDKNVLTSVFGAS